MDELNRPKELSDCPFCGWHAPALKYVSMDRYQIQCPGCGGSGGICKGISAAMRQWNTRADLPNKESAHE